MATLTILTVNVGSSSVKLRAVVEGEVVDAGDLSVDAASEEATIDGDQLIVAVTEMLDRLAQVDAFAHRIVHGGAKHHAATVVDDTVIADLVEAVDLAPLHGSIALQALRSLRARWPTTTHVACFDTGFHAGLPEAARRYALPSEWTDTLGVVRFGFHGLSHAYVAQRVSELASDRPLDRIVVCHLGAGASLAAVAGGRSVDTTMGFTPLEGLVMATRAGDVDPGAVLWIQEQLGLSPRETAHALNHRSGLLGLAGTGDLRLLLDRRQQGDERAAAAIAVYVHRLRKGVAAMAAAASGLDALVFTGGVGERAAPIRAEVCTGLRFLGVELDGTANEGVGGDPVDLLDVATDASPVRVYVIAAREELQMAREAEQALREG